MRTGELLLLAEFVVLIKAGLTGQQNAVAVGKQFDNAPAGGTGYDRTDADNLDEAATAENNAAGTFGVLESTGHH